MPKATANTEETERKELKSCPGGFVVLRRMTYGQFVARRELTKLSVSGQKKDFKGELAMASAAVSRFEFEHCIVDHNLEDADGRKLNLHGDDFGRLDPRIGQEIEGYIGEMNNFADDDEALGN